MNKKLINNISLLAVFIPLTVVLNMMITSIPPFGRLDLTHLPTLALSITHGPWIAFINGFFSDVLGTTLRGWTPWLQISFARGLQGLVAGYLIRYWFKKGKQLNILSIIVLFIILFFGVELLGFAWAFYVNAGRPIGQSIIIFVSARALKTPIILPLWIMVMKHFGQKVGKQKTK